MCIVFFPNIFGFCFCKNVGIKSRPDLKSLFPQFFYARELFKYVSMKYFKVQTKKIQKHISCSRDPSNQFWNHKSWIFCSKICWFTFFFRKKLQIVFLCKLNSYTYLVYFDSSKKPVFDQIKTNIKKILAS